MSPERLLNGLGVWVGFSSVLPFEGWDSGRRKMDKLNFCQWVVDGVVLNLMGTVISDRPFKKPGLLMLDGMQLATWGKNVLQITVTLGNCSGKLQIYPRYIWEGS